MLKFKNISRTCFIFIIAFTVYEQRAYIDVRYGGTYPGKNMLKQKLLAEFSSEKSEFTFNGLIFVSFIR